MINHIKNYLQWLETNMRQENIGPNIVEITTPFLDRHNDYHLRHLFCATVFYG